MFRRVLPSQPPGGYIVGHVFMRAVLIFKCPTFIEELSIDVIFSPLKSRFDSRLVHAEVRVDCGAHNQDEISGILDGVGRAAHR